MYFRHRSRNFTSWNQICRCVSFSLTLASSCTKWSEPLTSRRRCWSLCTSWGTFLSLGTWLTGNVESLTSALEGKTVDGFLPFLSLYSFTSIMQESIRVNPSMVTKLRATFLKVSEDRAITFSATGQRWPSLLPQSFIQPNISSF